MNKPIYILGAGGHAKVLLESLQQDPKNNIIGFLEINPDLIGTSILGVKIYSQDVVLNQFLPSNILLVNGIGSVSIPTLRQKQFETLKKAGYDFLSVIHKMAYYSSDVSIGEGAQLLARSTILTGTKIGCNTIINTSASIDHDCTIGNHVHIAPGVVLSGGICIEDACHIGTGAAIIQGIHIDKNSWVAAGAVVTKNLPANSRVAGLPARPITAD